MSYCWWLILTSYIGSVSLQYISSGGPQLDDSPHYPLQSNLPPSPYANYFNLPPLEAYNLPNTEEHSKFYTREDQEQIERKRRDIDDVSKESWLPNLVDKDYQDFKETIEANPFVVEGFGAVINGTEYDLLQALEKRSFSPWGGKRTIDQGWSWKRNSHEANMPKRVRFSPWGGKRSGQILYKPGNSGMKSSKMIFSTTVPELTNVITNYSPQGLNLAGFHFKPDLGKRHPIEILALNVGSTRDALPFKQFLENIPKSFKLGHTYSEVNLKKDGKRKMKFSTWGGKRSAPIIGPIWKPQDMKTETLDEFLLMNNEKMKTAAPF